MFETKWYRWFAWRPIRVDSGRFVWFRVVQRRDCEDMGGSWSEYRSCALQG